MNYIIDEQLLNELIQFIQRKATYIEGVNLINRMTTLEELTVQSDPNYRPVGFQIPEEEENKKKNKK